MVSLVKWFNKELSVLIGCDLGEEYAKNILSIDTEDEIKEFIGSLIDLSKPKNKNFLDELLRKLNKPSQYQDVKVYRKPDLEDSYSKSKNKKQTNKNQENEIVDTKQQNLKKSGQVLYSTQPGQKSHNRHVCECQATKHKLIGNCLKCGRVVCEQEGSGPCYFCGNLVCTKEEFEKIRSGSNKGEQLRVELMKRAWNAFDIISDDLKALSLARITNQEMNNDVKLKQAVEHKNKLIDYDRTSAKRTQVIDDESDYFNTNSKWLSQKQRTLLEQKESELREKRFGSKLNKTFTLDFAGRKVVDEQKEIDPRKYVPEIDKILNEKTNNPTSQANSVANQGIDDITLKFVEDKTGKKTTTTSNRKILVADKENKKGLRLQDSELQEMKDDGMCLSMHQPWASLLVTGIKKHEGRTWYSPYRGRLWIHAGSKQPSETDIQEVETFYKIYYKGQQIEFPDSYPTSCLLGYVDFTDCLSSEAYREIYPNGESESEFVFICANARELVMKIPMSGQHKIFKLDKSVHSIAKKTSVICPEEDI